MINAAAVGRFERIEQRLLLSSIAAFPNGRTRYA